MLVLRPNGLFAARRSAPPEPLTGTFIAPSRPWHVPRPVGRRRNVIAAALLPLIPNVGYAMQVMTNAWLYAILAVSLTLVAGTLGQVSLGQAGLLLIGAYASALLALDLSWPVWLSIPAAGIVTAALGTALTWPAFRLRSHYVSIATLGIGEIVGLVILNWESLTRGPMGVPGIPPLEIGPLDLSSPKAAYWLTLGLMVLLALAQSRLLRTHLGRTFRAIRDDDVAARTYGVSLDRYKGIAFAVSGFAAGISGAISAHLYSYINNETWTSQVSILALTMVILGGMGNVLGAIIGAVVLTGLPEVFRFTAEYRLLIYGFVLLLVIRFRPQGLLGTA